MGDHYEPIFFKNGFTECLPTEEKYVEGRADLFSVRLSFRRHHGFSGYDEQVSEGKCAAREWELVCGNGKAEQTYQ